MNTRDYITENQHEIVPIALPLLRVNHILSLLAEIEEALPPGHEDRPMYGAIAKDIVGQCFAYLPELKELFDREQEQAAIEAEEDEPETEILKIRNVPVNETPKIDVKAFLDEHRERAIYLKLPYSDVFNVLVCICCWRDTGGITPDEILALQIISSGIIGQLVKQFPECYPVHINGVSPVPCPDNN